MNQTAANSPVYAQIDIQESQVVLLFPNQPGLVFSREVSDIRCAGFSPTYTRKAWLWCAYRDALQTEEVELSEEVHWELFQEIWRGVEEGRSDLSFDSAGHNPCYHHRQG